MKGEDMKGLKSSSPKTGLLPTSMREAEEALTSDDDSAGSQVRD